jgi:hypothetical protein
MDLLDEDLVDLIHRAVCLFRAEPFGQGRESHHVTEHDRDLFVFALNLVLLGQYFLDNAVRKVFLDLFDFLARGEFASGGFNGNGYVLTALIAELAARWILASAMLTGKPKLIAALIAEFGPFSVFEMTIRTFHMQCPSGKR